MDWTKEFPGSILLCDINGTVTEMNERAASSFADDGGYGLIGKNLFECHTDASKKPNVYTIEKNEIKKLIYQSPWYVNGEMKGLVELSLEIPFHMPHFIR